MTRFSVGWRTEAKRQLFEHLDRRGYEVDLYDVQGRGAGCTTRRAAPS
jgi:hypothetical protein